MKTQHADDWAGAFENYKCATNAHDAFKRLHDRAIACNDVGAASILANALGFWVGRLMELAKRRPELLRPMAALMSSFPLGCDLSHRNRKANELLLRGLGLGTRLPYRTARTGSNLQEVAEEMLNMILAIPASQLLPKPRQLTPEEKALPILRWQMGRSDAVRLFDYGWKELERKYGAPEWHPKLKTRFKQCCVNEVEKRLKKRKRPSKLETTQTGKADQERRNIRTRQHKSIDTNARSKLKSELASEFMALLGLRGKFAPGS